MNRKVSSMMCRDVCLVDMDDTIASIEHRLAQDHLTWAPVVEGGCAILGVISAADLLRFHAEGREADAVRAWQMCTYRPVTVSADADLAEVARQMVDRNIHHVVVSEAGAFVGVLSSLDFVREFADTDARDSARA